MAKLSKTERLRRYRQSITHARRYRMQERYDDTWRRMIDLYKGKHFPQAFSNEDRIAVNIAFSTVNVIFPSISVNHPKIEVLANKADFEDQATISQAVINYWWRHWDFRTPFRRATKDYLTIGHGWVKVGYRYKEQDQQLDPQAQQAHADKLISEADQFAADNPELAAGLPTNEDIQANVPSTHVVVVEDRPYIERISPFDMFVDPEATCMDDAKWIAQRIVRPIEDVRNDKRYKEGVRRRVKADAGINTDWLTEQERKKRQDEIDRVTIWEFYDIKENSMCVFSEGDEDYLVDPRDIPYAFGHPYEFIANYEVPEAFYPIGDLEMIEDVQQELNKTRSQMMNHRKKYARKYLYRTAAFSPEGRQALESPEDNVMVEVVDDNLPLQDVVSPLPITPMSSDLYQYSEIIQSDMDRVSGVSEFARGGQSELRRSATEAAMIQDATNARAADKLSVIELAVGRIARKVMQLAQQFMTQEQVIRIAGSDGAQYWIPFSYKDIKGEFDFNVEGGSTQPMNETNRRQQAVAMMNSLGPLIGQVIDPVEMTKYVLQNGFGIRNPEKFLIQQQPMMPMGQPQVGPDGQPVPPQPGGAAGGPAGVPPSPFGMNDFKGEPGLNGEQLPPQELLALQQQGGQSQISGIPPELVKQLMNQVGMQAGVRA